MTPDQVRTILRLPMMKNDSGATTVGGYLQKLLVTLWIEQEGFSGKRPFGNSGWDYDLMKALADGGFIKGEIDEDGYFYCSDNESVRGYKIIKALLHNLNLDKI
jgi:hypothetical protein